MSIFDEKYRVVAIESDHLLIRGVVSGKVLTITTKGSVDGNEYSSTQVFDRQ